MGVLADARVVLRDWQESDAAWYAEQVPDPAIQQFTSEPIDLTESQVREAINHANEQPDQAGWAITVADTGELAGNVSLDLATGELSYWVAPTARGRGLATSAIRLIVDYGFAATTLSRLLLWTHPDNVASGRAAERAGFTRRPDLDQTKRLRDEQITTHYYAIERDCC